MSNNQRLVRRMRSVDTRRIAVEAFQERAFAMRGWLNEQDQQCRHERANLESQRDNASDVEEHDNATFSIGVLMGRVAALQEVRLQLETMSLIPSEGERMTDT